MEQTWRWFGPNDPVDLGKVRQAGATGIVSALHELAVGEVWTREAISKRKRLIERAGLVWSVVESLPVHPDVRLGAQGAERYLTNYKASLVNLASEGLKTVCYNFMPVLDWTRTSTKSIRPDGSSALSFDAELWAAFDLFILERPGAEADYTEPEARVANQRLSALSALEREELVHSATHGLPGNNEGGHSLLGLKRELERWQGVTRKDVEQNLARFLTSVLPVCDEHQINLCIHPDDPPRPLLGLPRVVSSAADCRRIFASHPSLHNGLTLCAGSFAADPNNKPHELAEEFAERVHFCHLRSVQVAADGKSFVEEGHLSGDVRLIELLKSLVAEERRRHAAGRSDWQIPMRPDHGHALTGDIASLPGYPWLGRLKGLAELRGALTAVEALT